MSIRSVLVVVLEQGTLAVLVAAANCLPSCPAAVRALSEMTYAKESDITVTNGNLKKDIHVRIRRIMEHSRWLQSDII
ncbi:hypothetical protein PPTG_22313 [Phytophthora nicotianae INRA-310]|uniref:Secreted protein n=1 Tax=Phytophthora nicotianae (strain INRA-310) TaxID=761204 RepID=W2QJ26_PHYN3|nr:hypothetical protein PPTG_22313 [Phytophthora nicotianae INRA-310]ETN13152.1 hypothetical protein PPTG_22313 [Phytophthora nicotianae INRA-310]